MTKHTEMTLDGRTYVVLPRDDYDALRAAAEDTDDELAGIAAMKARDEALASGTHLSMPRDQWARIRNGESPVRVVREFRGLTQAELSTKSGVARPMISDIEAGKKQGSIDSVKAIARALSAPLDVIVGE